MYGYGRSPVSNPFKYSNEAKPKREVFPTSEIPHLWAHQTQTRARNPQGNLFFEGATIYSYRHSWPLARIYENKRGKLVLTNSQRYSVTTSQHASDVSHAIPGDWREIAVPHVECNSGTDGEVMRNEHAANLKHLEDVAAENLAKAKRCMRAYYAEHITSTARQALIDAAAYMAFFGIRRKAPAIPEAEYAAAIERAKAIENPDPVRDAKKFKARARRQAKMQAALQGVFDAYCVKVEAYNAARRAECAALPDAAAYWREHGRYPDEPRSDLEYPRLELPGVPYWRSYKAQRKMEQAGFTLPEIFRPDQTRDVLLRVDGEEIQTSLGARVPVAAAPMVWSIVHRAKLNGEAYVPNGTRLRIGHYPLDRVDADGTLHAGCHVIKHDELARMARTLNLEGATTE